MGLFGPGPVMARIGGGAEGAAARKVIERIAGSLESELRDTPGEYFVLQAAGMLFACRAGAVKNTRPVRTMEESLNRAAEILSAFTDEPATDKSALRSRADSAYMQLRGAAKSGVNPALLVGTLSHYLHYIESGYLSIKPSGGGTLQPTSPDPGLSYNRRRSDLSVERPAGRKKALLLGVLLALPVLGGAIGLVVSLWNPDLRTAMAKLFFACLAASGAGQAVFHGKRVTALVIIVCAVVVILSIR